MPGRSCKCQWETAVFSCLFFLAYVCFLRVNKSTNAFCLFAQKRRLTTCLSGNFVRARTLLERKRQSLNFKSFFAISNGQTFNIGSVNEFGMSVNKPAFGCQTSMKVYLAFWHSRFVSINISMWSDLMKWWQRADFSGNWFLTARLCSATREFKSGLYCPT